MAEHGALIKQNEVWKPSQSQKNDLSHVYPILEAYTDRLPGSFIEEKDYALVWHYRNANFEKAERLAKELFDTLITFTANEALQVLPGNKVIEVKPIMVNKGIIAEVTNLSDYDYILVLGDDTTDEDMFKVMPENAISIKVGDGASVAKYNIKSQAEVITLLESLTC